MKKALPILFSLLFITMAHAQVLITEIMYNPPEAGQDTLEFIELYNNSGQDLDLSGYSFSEGIEEIPNLGILPADSYLVICEDSIRFVQAFGNLDYLFEWDNGALSNGGEDIAITDPNGVIIDYVDYGNGGDWPSEAAGGGPSIERCDLDSDGNNGGNWKASNTPTGFFREGTEIYATPGAAPEASLCDNVVTPDELKLSITEVMYNDPGAVDGIEFIEIYNNGDVSANLTNYRLTVGSVIDYTFDQEELAVGEYILLAKDPTMIQTVYGVSSLAWGDGGISDGGALISLFAANGDLLDAYDISDMTGAADGTGSSWCNCDMLTGIATPVWAASRGITPDNIFDYQGNAIISNPMRASVCQRATADVATLDSTGLSLIDKATVVLSGTLTSSNFSTTGLSFSIESDSEGIFLFSESNFGGGFDFEDEVMIQGFVTNFNGINQIELDTIVAISTPGTYDAPVVVTELNDDTEAELITLENVSLVDPTQWELNGSFNVSVTDGTNEYTVRVDNDTDIIGMAYPTGTFNITGVGSQFDQSSPYESGYQLLPRFSIDIDPYVPFVAVYPAISIPEVKQTNANGEAARDGETYTVTGVVHGVDFNSGGTQFYIIDENGEGLLISSGSTTAYVVTEGDDLSIEGTVGFFRGVVDFEPVNITVNSSSNGLTSPRDVTMLSEDTESDLVKLSGLSYIDATEWKGDGSSFNVTFTDGTNEFTVRIDNDTELATMTAPFQNSSTISIIGFGSQFANAPYTDGYQLFPRVIADFDSASNTKNLLSTDQYDIFPNPTSNSINISSELDFVQYTIQDITGRIITSASFTKSIDVRALECGTYMIKLETADQIAISKFVKL